MTNEEEQFAELNLPPEEQWENLTLANDFIFGWVFHDVELCTEMLKRILPELDIGQIIFINTQKTIKSTVDNYGVRLDIFVQSNSGKIYNIEIQTTNKKDLAPRSRAYHIIMGSEVMQKNEGIPSSGKYENMPESYVIFICTFDPFNEGRHIYTFRNTCKEVPGLELNDGGYTIFLNTKGRKDDVSLNLEAFLELLNGKVIVRDDPFINALIDKTKIAKQDHTRRREYMWEMMKRRELIGEARAKYQADMSKAMLKLASKYGMSKETAEMLIADIIRSIEEEHNIKLMEQQTQWQK